MLHDPAGSAGLQTHGDFRNAVPTPDHFIPLLYIAGLAAASGRAHRRPRRRYSYGSLSMTAYTLTRLPRRERGQRGRGRTPGRRTARRHQHLSRPALPLSPAARPARR
ncbi:hypothetical protein [Streptomyces sp. KL116D]|uniref:hypothetical protein n=1 Tax=Streptomyces sp. KL116D TaxID=3045152 RepID=UPI003556E5EB